MTANHHLQSFQTYTCVRVMLPSSMTAFIRKSRIDAADWASQHGFILTLSQAKLGRMLRETMFILQTLTNPTVLF